MTSGVSGSSQNNGLSSSSFSTSNGLGVLAPPITFNGISSGLPVNSIISQLMAIESQPLVNLENQQQTLSGQDQQYQQLNSLLNTLQSSINALTPDPLLNKDPFSNFSITSSNSSIVTATADTTATPQMLQVQVQNLATATTAQSQSGVGALATSSTPLSSLDNGNITAGSFKIYVNGTASTINVDPTNNNTLDSVLSQIRSVAGITGASVNASGNIVLSFNGGTNVQLGATGDTSNFLSATKMDTAVNNGTSLTSSTLLSTINANASIENNSLANFQTAVTAGSTFQIGGATFSTTGLTLNQLISQINSNSAAGVTASYNTVTNQMQLVSKTTGSTLINLKDTSGNFLQAMGLISAGGDSTVSQTVGANAKFTVNNATLYSASNTVSPVVSGITGVTLNLASQSPGTTVNLNIQSDTTQLTQNIKSFLTAFNGVTDFIQAQTDPQSATAQLHGDFMVSQFRTNMQTLMSNTVSGDSPLSSLMDLGISTGPITSSGTVNTDFSLDTSKLNAALASNPNQVKDIMVGPNGILTRLQTMVTAAVNTDPNAGGLIESHNVAYQARMSQLNDSITNMQQRLNQKQQQLQQEYAAMDQLIAQSQSQGTAISGLAAQLTANSKG